MGRKVRGLTHAVSPPGPTSICPSAASHFATGPSIRMKAMTSATVVTATTRKITTAFRRAGKAGVADGFTLRVPRPGQAAGRN